MQTQSFLNEAQIAKILKIRRKTVRYLAEHGKIPCLPITTPEGDTIFRFSLDLIQKYMLEHTVSTNSALKSYKPGRYGC